jgi:TPR repeat protein
MTMYENGDGVPRDTQKAILWLHRLRDTSLGELWKKPN